MSKSPVQTPDAEDTARYIAGIAKELRALAAGANLGFLSYLLAMGEEDANATAREADRKAGVMLSGQ